MREIKEMKYRNSPLDTKLLPPGIPYIIGNEAAERFSFYGMKAILAVFMTKYLCDQSGNPDYLSEGQATVWVHVFNTAVYFTPLFGSIIADAFWGKYRTIISLSLVYCLGHLALALDETRVGLTIGLTLIAIGAGGIKGCVSAHVGDQFGRSNVSMLEKVYGWFYLAINLGAFASTLLTPWLLDEFGPSIAFGIPGFLMLVATFAFWAGRNDFAHIPPSGFAFIRDACSASGLKTMSKLLLIYLFVAVFWALFDQTASTWVFQAEKMDRFFCGVEWEAAQIQAVNPALILILIPLFNYFLYPVINRFFSSYATEEDRYRILPCCTFLYYSRICGIENPDGGSPWHRVATSLVFTVNFRRGYDFGNLLRVFIYPGTENYEVPRFWSLHVFCCRRKPIYCLSKCNYFE